MMQRDINITIKIEGSQHFSIKIPIDEETNAREAEKIVNYIYKSWKEKLPNLSNMEIMARIAFHMARKYEELNKEVSAITSELEACESKLDDLLLATE